MDNNTTVIKSKTEFYNLFSEILKSSNEINIYINDLSIFNFYSFEDFNSFMQFKEDIKNFIHRENTKLKIITQEVSSFDEIYNERIINYLRFSKNIELYNITEENVIENNMLWKEYGFFIYSPDSKMAIYNINEKYGCPLIYLENINSVTEALYFKNVFKILDKFSEPTKY